MKTILRPAIVLFVALTVLTGLVYPAVVTAIGQAAFPHQANGSLIERDGRAVGSEIIGQQFDAPQYFWGRLSATTPNPYNAGSSSGSNLGPTNPALADEIKGRIDALHAADPDNRAPLPVDLVTSSGSGLDPEISPAAAAYQVARVAKARGMTPAQVEALVSEATSARQFGVLGEPRVNVLKLNLALDAARG
ncbi:potassium-transporting ATPase subunit KdpC [Caballeronia sp. LZ029]|uniref:potassium-transporting ATPase subunit KdpC n=1 Tax=Caballeronia sp. LZ029 TaxID=3038564 RepID=UPI0028642472|nr:potassium-transporting ATPase subunit KdpC [Caballeronia sp. LZ029]MDR5748575.1 potassium-transporting ATPase subunit KdpC [Caballeronia sp. LZ029]